MANTGIEIRGKLDFLGPVEKLKTVKNKETGELKFTTDTTHRIKAVLKKMKLDRDENLVEGTGNPWGRIQVEGFDPLMLKDFGGMELGDDVIISIRPAGKN
jgi:hypothetical protein